MSIRKEGAPGAAPGPKAEDRKEEMSGADPGAAAARPVDATETGPWDGPPPSLPVPCLAVDPTTTRVLEANDAARAWWGGDGSDPVGVLLSEQAEGGDLEGAALASALLDGRTVPIRRGDGALRWVEAAGVPTEGGTALVVLQDVTDRVRLEERLEERRRLFDDILDNIEVDVAVFDPDLRFEYANASSIPDPELRRWLVGRTNRDYCRSRGKPMSIAEQRESEIRRAVEAGRPHWTVEYMPDRHGKEHYILRAHVPLFDREGLLRRIIGYGFDRTEQVTAEEALEEARRSLRSFSRLEATGRLAAGVAHEFNNLLTVLSVRLQLLLEDHGAEGDELAGSLQEMVAAVDRAAALVEGLRHFGRRHVSAPAVVDVNEVLREKAELLSRPLEPGVDPVLELCPDALRVHIDAVELEQALLNLLLNARDAVKARDGAGTITVRTWRPADGEPRARISVADTGCGMEPEVLRRAFEPFFTTKDAGEGTGLGLSAVYGIVQNAGGDVALDSEPGRGTTATIELPLVEG